MEQSIPNWRTFHNNSVIFNISFISHWYIFWLETIEKICFEGAECLIEKTSMNQISKSKPMPSLCKQHMWRTLKFDRSPIFAFDFPRGNWKSPIPYTHTCFLFILETKDYLAKTPGHRWCNYCDIPLSHICPLSPFCHNVIWNYPSASTRFQYLVPNCRVQAIPILG